MLTFSIKSANTGFLERFLGMEHEIKTFVKRRLKCN